MTVTVGTTAEERTEIAEGIVGSISAPKPNLMKLAILTAAIKMPGLEKEDLMGAECEVAQHQAGITWVHIARKLGELIGREVGIQLAMNLPGPDDYIDQSKMLDPVCCHGWVRTHQGKGGAGVDMPDEIAKEVIDACGGSVKIHSCAAFLNLLHDDEDIRKQIHGHTLRVGRAAVSLGTDNITGFIGRNVKANDDEQIGLFEKQVIPLLKELKENGIKKFRVEPCPMYGWGPEDTILNNIAYNAPVWVMLAKLCEKHGLEDMFRITYDESHSILMGQDHWEVFNSLQKAGFAHLIDEFHGKGLDHIAAKIAAHGILGKRVGLGARTMQGDIISGAEGNAWGVYPALHTLPGIEMHNPLAVAMKKMADWPGHQYHARSVLGLDPKETVWILEHEMNAAGPDGKSNLRVENVELVVGALAHSLGYIAAVDEAVDQQFKLRKYAEKNGAHVPNAIDFPGSVTYPEIPGLDQEMEDAMAFVA